MSYINEPTSSLVDLITKLNTFVVGTPGWSGDELNTGAGEWAVSKTGAGLEARMAAQWDTGAPGSLGLYQYHGAVYVPATVPWAQNDDSGNGAASTSEASLAASRNVFIGNTPIQYWAFEDDDYVHVVVEVTAGVYTHFGFGQLLKFGDWTGGEYVYGWRFHSGVSTDVSIQLNSTHLLDGLLKDGAQISNAEEFAATIHIESLPGQVASGKYAVHMGDQLSTNLGNDRQAAPKAREHFVWGLRGGPYARLLSRFDGSDLSGHLPMYPIVTAYWRRGNGDVYGPMGVLKDVRGVSIRNYVGGQELTVGGDTWVIFPSRSKWLGGAHTGSTDYQGIAYKKITT